MAVSTCPWAGIYTYTHIQGITHRQATDNAPSGSAQGTNAEERHEYAYKDTNVLQVSDTTATATATSLRSKKVCVPPAM